MNRGEPPHRLARSALLVAALVSGVIGLACNPITTRPVFLPFPEAIEDTVQTGLPQTVRAFSSALQAQGLPVRVANERDGYVETHSFDVRTGERRGGNAYNPDQIAVLRFWAQETPRSNTRVQAEAAVRWTADPSLQLRLRERMAEEEHPARQLLDRILDAVKQRFGDR